MKFDININDDLTEEITPEQDARWKQIYEHLTEVVKLISKSDDSGEMFGILCASVIMLFRMDRDNEKLIDEVEHTVINLMRLSNREGK